MCCFPGDVQTKQQIRDAIIESIVGQADSLNILEQNNVSNDASGGSGSEHDVDDVEPPSTKHRRLGLFASYSTRRVSGNNTVASAVSIRRLVMDYIQVASELSVSRGDSTSESLWLRVAENKLFAPLHLLFEKIFSAPATSAPVERVFSSSGLLMRPHRARMSDLLLSQLVFLTCNNK